MAKQLNTVYYAVVATSLCLVSHSAIAGERLSGANLRALAVHTENAARLVQRAPTTAAVSMPRRSQSHGLATSTANTAKHRALAIQTDFPKKSSGRQHSTRLANKFGAAGPGPAPALTCNSSGTDAEHCTDFTLECNLAMGYDHAPSSEPGGGETCVSTRSD